MYAGTPGDGVFKSTDGGETWSAANAGVNLCNSFCEAPPVGVNTLAIDPATPSTLYAGYVYENYGVFKSTNEGESWNFVTISISGSLS